MELFDRFGVAEIEPALDEWAQCQFQFFTFPFLFWCQDWVLEAAERNATHTVLFISRLLVTGDDQVHTALPLNSNLQIQDLSIGPST